MQGDPASWSVDGTGGRRRTKQQEGSRDGDCVGRLDLSRLSPTAADDACWVHVASYLGEDLSPLAAAGASFRCLGHFQRYMLCLHARWTESHCSLCEAPIQCIVSEHTHSFVDGCAVLRYNGMTPTGAPYSYAWVPSLDVLACSSCAALAPDEFSRRAHRVALERSHSWDDARADTDISDMSSAASAER